MTAALEVRGDLARIQRAMREEPKIAARAALAAVNKTVALAQTAGVRELARAKRLPIRALRARTRILKATRARLSAKLITLTAGMPIDRLPFRQGRKGITAAGRKFASAFVYQRAKPVIFERRIIGGKRAGRLPIDRVKVEINPEADRLFTVAVARAQGRDLPRLFERELVYRLGRRG
jgi:hypothetical protein